jgi:integrase
MSCKEVPLGYRLLYGLLGLRVSEALALRIRDVDDGVITLDTNKTDDPREWTMDPGVRDALEQWVEHWRKGAHGDSMLITETDGNPLDMDHAADRFRAHLKQAGVERPELFERTPSRMPVRVHDLRATFVTLSLAHGRSETWVSDRTGHKSSRMIHRGRCERHAGDRVN